MKITAPALALLALFTIAQCPAQSMFRGDAAHSGVYRGEGPRQFHRIKWKFPTGDRVVSSPVWNDNVLYFGGDDGNVYAVDADTGRQLWKHVTGGPVPSSPAIDGGIVYVGSYDGKFYALNARTGATKWKFATAGERRFEARGLHGMHPKNQTIADPYDVYLSSPVVVKDTVFFGSGDSMRWMRSPANCAGNSRRGDVVHASPAVVDGGRVCRQLGQFPVCHRRCHRQGKVALPFRRGSADPQSGRISVVAGRGRRHRLQRLPRFEPVRDRRRDGHGEMALQHGRKLGHLLARRRAWQGVLRHVRFESLPRRRCGDGGKRCCSSKARPTYSPRPPSRRDVVLLGVLNGSLEARDINSGELLWDFQTDASKRNAGWALTTDRKFNGPMLYRSNWREGPLVATERQNSVGSIYSSPLVVGGVVYFAAPTETFTPSTRIPSIGAAKHQRRETTARRRLPRLAVWVYSP